LFAVITCKFEITADILINMKGTFYGNGLPRGKVKQYRNRPGVAQRVPEGLGSQIPMTFGT
jgi:hypothetical protein